MSPFRIRFPLPGGPGAFRALGALLGAMALFWAWAAASPAAGASTKPKVRLYIFNCGHARVADGSVYTPGENIGVPRELEVNCYLIVHPKGKLIWGTGLNDAIAEQPQGVTAGGGNFKLTKTVTLVAQLKQLGIDPKQIDYVSASHMHPDHSGNANLFTASTLILQEEEYEAAFGPDPGKYRFNPEYYGKLKGGTVIKLHGDYDVFGDSSVTILRSPGHTPGHQSLFVDLPQHGPVLLSGDLWHFAENRQKRRVPAFNFDREATLRSMDYIERWVAARGAEVWIEHDPDQTAKLSRSPRWYE
jgi:glyoxylase-like metal-dependent hydrolase (beta-lactamase superfamily II)